MSHVTLGPGEVSWAEARERAYAAGRPLPVEDVDLAGAWGRRTAVPVRTRTPLPPAPTSAMDGWAVSGSGPWQVVGTALAGRPPGPALRPGTCLEVATGTALPEGTTGVLRREHGGFDEAGRLTGDVDPGQDVRPAGEECPADGLLLPSGSYLDPVRLGLLAAGGHDTVSVVRRPRVRVLVLGDELLDHGVSREGRVRDSLGPQLPGWLVAWGCEVAAVRRVADTAHAHLAAIADRSDRADIVVTTGGTAAGPVDFVRPSIVDTGGRILIGGVDCRPGHPMLLASWGNHWLVGLPGNPFAAVAALLTLLDPLLRALGSASLPVLDTVLLAGSVASRGSGTRLVPCALAEGTATPVTGIGSGMLRGLAQADGLGVVAGHASSGDRIGWLPLPFAAYR